ncbi:MAG: Allophanate hydrolase subunit 1 [Syntrophaceae bacterium PtaU1.Bin231]|nr:MAG: Allophanate hydrolase subunit 1 [Syntrophaceae bacterium PtaU1.Bin231]
MEKIEDARLCDAGDSCLFVEFGTTVDRALNARVQTLKKALEALSPSGVVETVPTYRSLAIYYDPLRLKRSDLVEWQWNLSGRVIGAGCETHAENAKWQSWPFDGGFATSGSFEWVAGNNPAEGSSPEKAALARVACVALPDDATVVVLQQAETLRPIFLNKVMGLYLNIPNDVYNGGKRTYRINGEERQVTGAGGGIPLPAEDAVRCQGGTLTVDGRLSVGAIYGDDDLTLYRPGYRQVNLAHQLPLAFSGRGGNLYCDVVCMGYRDQQRFYEARESIYDLGAVIRIDGKGEARKRSESNSSCKVVEVVGTNGVRYLLAVNFGQAATTVTIPEIDRDKVKICCGQAEKPATGGLALPLAAGAVTLLSY